MTPDDSENCAGCDHPIALHYNDVRGVARCSNVDSGTSTKGIIGLPYSVRCDCKDFSSPSRAAQQDAEGGDIERFRRGIAELLDKPKSSKRRSKA